VRALERVSWDDEDGRKRREMKENVQLKDVNIADAGCCGESVLARAETVCFLHRAGAEAVCW